MKLVRHEQYASKMKKNYDCDNIICKTIEYEVLEDESITKNLLESLVIIDVPEGK